MNPATPDERAIRTMEGRSGSCFDGLTALFTNPVSQAMSGIGRGARLR